MQMPIMLELKDKKVTVIGGGPVGHRKARKLADFGAVVTCVSKTFCDGFTGSDDIKCVKATYMPEDLQNCDLVVAATDDEALNAEILQQSRKKNILCMTVDAGNSSDFSFMATAVKEQLLIGVSTQGGSPVFAKELVEQLMSTVSVDVLDRLATMIEERKRIMRKREEV